jgi:ergothioneine biosynthesis protein EgtB
MWHRLAFEEKVRPDGYVVPADARVPSQEWMEIPAGRATLGTPRHDTEFRWDNEQPLCTEDVPAFAIDRYDVTNADYLGFVEANGYGDKQWWRAEDWAWIEAEGVLHPLFWEPQGDGWTWRGMFESIPLPPSWPVFVSHAEASAYARWRGVRLPTEAEFQRAAYGSPSGERVHPWGNTDATAQHGAFDFCSWDPHPIGSHPAGRSAWGVDDLVGNGWEWTQTVFGPFPGFTPIASYPEYSADFFDGEHFVLKGASMVTARELLRPTFRNWFRPRYPYVYATFRCVLDRSRS